MNDKFDNIKFKSAEYWEERYSQGGNSGNGSYGHLAEFKAEVINSFIEKHEIKSLIEWGCGDGNQLGAFCCDEYVGYDVSETAVEICREKYMHDEKKHFVHYSGDRTVVHEKADMALSLDVIYHLIEDDVFETYMHNLFTSSGRWVCIYSSNEDRRTALHVKRRKFTDYVDERFSEWKLEKVVKQKYPEDTRSDFYFYVLK